MFDLREFRWIHRLHQKDIATILKVSVQAVSNWELNKRQMPLDKALKLCKEFDCDISELIKKED